MQTRGHTKKIRLLFNTTFRNDTQTMDIDANHWNSQVIYINKHFASFGVRLKEGQLKDDQLMYYVEGITPELVEQEPKFKATLLMLNTECKAFGFSAIKVGNVMMQKPGDLSKDVHQLYYVAVTRSRERQRLTPSSLAATNNNNGWLAAFFLVWALLLSYYLFECQLADQAEPWKKIQFLAYQVAQQAAIMWANRPSML